MLCAAAPAYLMRAKEPLKNGFKRGRTYTAQKLAELDMQYNSWYISGLTDSKVFMANKTAPHALFTCRYGLIDSVYERLPFTPKPSVRWDRIQMQVDSPAVYLTDYKTHTFISAALPFANERCFFTKGLNVCHSVVLSSNSVIINGTSPACQELALQKIDLVYGSLAEVYLHTKPKGSSFGIDGFLVYNKAAARIIFTYYYRNQFICLDTNLNVLYTGKTIDTNTLAKIKTGEYIAGEKKVQGMVSTLTVNKRGCSDGNWYYNQALLPADNEDLKRFKASVVLDVYRLSTGQYSHSIYLPQYKGESLRSFMVRNNRLFALYGRYLVEYKIALL